MQCVAWINGHDAKKDWDSRMQSCQKTKNINASRNKSKWREKITFKLHGGCQMLPSYFDWHEGVVLSRCGNICQCVLNNYKLWLS